MADGATVDGATVDGAVVDVPTDDGVADAYLTPLTGGHGRPAVLFLMDAFGPRPRLFEMADRIAARGYLVLAPNLFYRHGPAPVLPDLSELMKPENRAGLLDQLRPLMQSLTLDLSRRDVAGYLDYLSTVAGSDAPVATTGYCMGGTLSLRTAGWFPDRVTAAASFHGGNLATEADDSPHRRADRIRAELYFGHADADHSMPPEQIERLETALAAAGVRFRSEVYPGAAHGFTMADSAAYDEAATDRHWVELFALLDRLLPAPGGVPRSHVK